MTRTSYIFKPKRAQAGAVAKAVRDLRDYGFTQHPYNLTRSRFIEYAIDRALEELRLWRGKFALDLKEYLYSQNPDPQVPESHVQDEDDHRTQREEIKETKRKRRPQWAALQQ